MAPARRTSPHGPKRDRTPPTKRKRTRYLDGIKDVDFRDFELLRKFVTEYGKIIPARLTGASPNQQRQIKRAVRRARNTGLLA
jgi:small subunit ribosomal protein S18